MVIIDGCRPQGNFIVPTGQTWRGMDLNTTRNKHPSRSKSLTWTLTTLLITILLPTTHTTTLQTITSSPAPWENLSKIMAKNRLSKFPSTKHLHLITTLQRGKMRASRRVSHARTNQKAISRGARTTVGNNNKIIPHKKPQKRNHLLSQNRLLPLKSPNN